MDPGSRILIRLNMSATMIIMDSIHKIEKNFAIAAHMKWPVYLFALLHTPIQIIIVYTIKNVSYAIPTTFTPIKS